MSHYNRISYTVVLLLINISSLVAQNFKEDFKKINLAYKDAVISSEMTYEYYPTHSAVQATKVETAKVCLKQGKYYMKMGQVEMIKNASVSLYVDHDEKMVTIMPAGKSAPTMDMLSSSLETISKACKKIEFKKIGASSQYTMIMSNDSRYKMVRVSFNEKTYWLDKIEFFYNETFLENENGEREAAMPRMVISYQNSKEVVDNVFSYTSILKSSNGRYVLQEKYKNYELISQ